jgi:dTDP-4-dehydrorhamnose 3,5-epimerase
MMASEVGKRLQVTPLAIPDVKLVAPIRRTDPRGYFAETFNRRDLAALGVAFDAVQDNQSLSRPKGTLRGLHFQVPPFAQAKLIRVLRGAIFDVAVDIRRGSPSFGRHVAVTLNADGVEQLFIPAGFAHGFCTLRPDTEVFYKVDNYYSAEHDRGMLWNDPDLAIDWPVSAREATLSDKDLRLPRLKNLGACFVFEGSAGAMA